MSSVAMCDGGEEAFDEESCIVSGWGVTKEDGKSIPDELRLGNSFTLTYHMS